jgi:hypothetical protein
MYNMAQRRNWCKNTIIEGPPALTGIRFDKNTTIKQWMTSQQFKYRYFPKRDLLLNYLIIYVVKAETLTPISNQDPTTA